MYTTPETVQKTIEAIRNSSHTQVKIGFTDLDGILRGKYLSREKFLGTLDGGLTFCSVVFQWDSQDRCIGEDSRGYPDCPLKIDLSTCRQIPWEEDLPFLLGDFESPQHDAFPYCPRQLLKKVLQQASDLGFQLQAGYEYEWFNFKETPQSLADKSYSSPQPLTPGMFGYSILRTSLNENFFSSLIKNLDAFGIQLEGLHTETGPGATEGALRYTRALEAADQASLFKTSVKELGYRLGILPSFMAKWHQNLPGCSGHVHQSLWDTELNRNLFYDEKSPSQMSETFKSYLAGQLHLLPELLPFYAPTINSYKRFVEGYWAPTYSNWAIDNRTTALRVLPGGPKSTRVEFRVPGADSNPYLVLAASLASGLYGIRNQLKLQDARLRLPEAALPKNLGEATHRLRQSSVAREIFGETFIHHFVKTRQWEWDRFQGAVTQWELQRYFESV